MSRLLILCMTLSVLAAPLVRAQGNFIRNDDQNNTILLQAEYMQRVISFDQEGFHTAFLRVVDKQLFTGKASEVSFGLYKAVPNKRPQGLVDEGGAAVQVRDELTETDELSITGDERNVRQAIEWELLADISAAKLEAWFKRRSVVIDSITDGCQRLRIRYGAREDLELNGLVVEVIYEIQAGFPAIRKWLEISNYSSLWLKVDRMAIDDVQVAESYRHITDLTPSGRGAVSSIRAFSDERFASGIIQVSEVPSALRTISDQGAMGYNPDHFEWVIGPSERFVSEAVSSYAFSGQSVKTASSLSKALDMEVEGRFQGFLRQMVGIKPVVARHTTPIWCSWSNYGPLINEANMTTAADIAAAIGIRTLLLDAGWSEAKTPNAIARYSVTPEPRNFPDFYRMAGHIKSRGLGLGLWVTCFRHPLYSRDLQVLPNGYSLPRIERDGALAMSFASDWRFYYANDLVGLYDRYEATYFKQDLTNIKFGDFADSHDSRTQKESLLRGLRGLFEAQDRVAALAPAVQMELTHEIYWGTPGTPCDVAALKHAHYFHVPPNDYSGAGHAKQRAIDQRKYNTDSLQARLIAGCWNARRQFFAHRGLPLKSIEYYGAATINLGGSLTPAIQRRQLCSWFMGAPSVFAGDLESLTAENRRVYREGFDLLSRLDSLYSVYDHFQYSGVPEPTDTDWHWWGKLNADGYGAVVVLRGNGGSAERAINIPWVKGAKRYRVRASFSGNDIGVFLGQELIDGRLSLVLRHYDQEILELMPI